MEDKNEKVSKEELMERVKWFGEKNLNYILSGFIIEKLVEFTKRDNKSMTDLITEMTLLYRDKELYEKKLELSNKKVELLEKLNDKNKVDINFYQNKISRLNVEISSLKSEITTSKINENAKEENKIVNKSNENNLSDLDSILNVGPLVAKKRKNKSDETIKDISKK